MSFFKSQWIVLSVRKFSESEMLYTIFFREYGTLSVKKKKKVREKALDIWYLISCEIYTSNQQTIHTIRNITVLAFFSCEWKKYTDLESFLYILKRIWKEIPKWNPHYEIYDLLHYILKNTPIIHEDILILFHAKIIHILWNLPENHKKPDIQKTLHFLHKYSYKQILSLWEIPIEIKKYLKSIIQN